MSGVPGRLRVGKLPVDVLTFGEALRAVDALCSAGEGGFVVTPNIDHVVLAEDDEAFLAAYEAASLSLADGFPVVATSKLMVTPLPEKISGSDLVLPLMRMAASGGRRVYLLGAGPGVAEKAAARLVRDLPDLKIVGVDAPRVDLSEPREARAPIVQRVREASPDIVLVAFGAPKQEIFCHEIVRDVAPAVLLGIGATLDFIAGTVTRAPPWMSKIGAEWAYRLAKEPRRLFHRYVVRDSRYPFIVLRQYLAARRAGLPFGGD